MEFEKIIKDIKNKVYHPVYFLMGEESYYIDLVTDAIEQSVLDENEKEFNLSILYGGESNLSSVIAEAKSFPMMSNYRVVIVKEAQNLKGLVPRAGKKEDTEEQVHPLVQYMDHPQRTTVLVFCHKHKTIDMRTSFAKAISKKAVVLKSDPIRDYQAPQWIDEYLKKQGYKAEPSVSTLLSEYLGSDLGKISNELQKLFLNLPKSTVITPEHVQQYIGISKEYNIFELQRAFARKEVAKVNKIMHFFAGNEKEHPLMMTTAGLFSYFNKLLVYHSLQDKSSRNVAAALSVPPFFVQEYAQAAANYPPGKVFEIISLLRKYDLKGKGVDNASSDQGELHKELASSILAL